MEKTEKAATPSKDEQQQNQEKPKTGFGLITGNLIGAAKGAAGNPWAVTAGVAVLALAVIGFQGREKIKEWLI